MNWAETRERLIECGIDAEVLPEEWQYRIDLRDADLYGASLYGASLRGASLRNADLYGASLRGASLRGASLRGADLRDADLYGADLRGASLYGADLYGASLRGADLRDADLYGADLRDADLYGADLRGASLRGADLPTYQKWSVTWRTDGRIAIGCKTKNVAEWDAWFASDEVYQTERNTADFERIEAAYQHAKRMVEIYQKYEAGEDANS